MLSARLVTGDRTMLAPGEKRFFMHGDPLTLSSDRVGLESLGAGSRPVLNPVLTGLKSPITFWNSMIALLNGMTDQVIKYKTI